MSIKVRRTRLSARLPAALRQRLRDYCAASGLSERLVVEEALERHLGGSSDAQLVLRRFDRVDEAVGRVRNDVELLAEAFGQYLRVWFAAHAPTETATMVRAETAYRWFAGRLGQAFTSEHRFAHDIPPDLSETDRD
jgi:predicted DNA-binding protein